MRVTAALMLAVVAQDTKAAAQEEALQLPSGLVATAQEVLTDRPAGGGLVYRFRFVAADLDAAAVSDPERVATDLEWLCTHYAIPRIAQTGPKPGRVVISLADKPSEFGVYASDVTQVFEAFSLKGDACIWEVF